MVGSRSMRHAWSEEISYYIAYCTAETTLDQLIHIAGQPLGS
ncbi:hypothetical protein [Streptomyces sp. NPDC006691]